MRIGAAAKIVVIVDEIGAGLNSDRADQRDQQAPSSEKNPSRAATAVPSSTGTAAALSEGARTACSQIANAPGRAPPL